MINFLLSANCATGGIPFDPTCFLSLPSTVWFPIFLLIIAVVLGIISVIYALSPMLGRNDIKVWARVKIYEVLLTVVLAIIFLAISSLLYTVNPVNTLHNIGLLPGSCNPANYNVPTSAVVTNIYSVSLCDMYQFNADVQGYSLGIFYLALVAGLSPSADFNGVVLVGGPTVLPASGVGASPSPGLGVSLNIQLIPIQFVLQYIIPLMGAFFTAIILSQMQQILLSASMILFSCLMIIGLVARAFGVTKTFGGAMIAFALGLGFIYPLVTLISYGFLDVAIQQTITHFSSSGTLLGILQGAAEGLTGAVYNIVFQSTPPCNDPSSVACQNTALSNVVSPFVQLGGFVSAGLLLLPLLNLIIVDSFIVDLSKVIGERIELMSLLTRIV